MLDNALTKLQILLIESNLNEAQNYQKKLMNLPASCVVTLANSLQEASQELGKQNFSIILLNLYLSDSKGLETLFRLNKLTVNTPILILTSLQDELSEVSALKEGAQGILYKEIEDHLSLFYIIKNTILQYRIQKDTLAKNIYFQDLVEHLPRAMVILDEGNIKFNNKEFITLVGDHITTSAIQEKPFIDFVHPSYIQYVTDWIKHIGKTAQLTQSIEAVLLKSNNAPINVELAASHLAYQNKIFTIIICNELTERIQTQIELNYLTKHSPVRPVVDNPILNTQLNLLIEENKKKHIVIMYINIDNFKLINETYGQKLGDSILQEIIQRLKKVAFKSDIIFPLGGDQFIVIANNVKSANHINPVIHKFMDTISRPYSLNGHKITPSFYAGISVFPEHGIENQSLLKNAILAYYSAKQSGIESYHFFTPAMAFHLKQKQDLLYDLKHAIEKNEFVLLYQPVVDCHTGQIISLEALLRWCRLNKEILLPRDFLSLAEESNLLGAISEWVIETACNQINHWQQQGASPVPISVNLSARQLDVQSTYLSESIKTILNKTNLSPHYLQLEFSESITVSNISIATLFELKKMGIEFILDDFGANYFSLHELKRYQIDSVKIDKSFVQAIPNDVDITSIVTAIIAMAKKLNLKVIASGLETKEQLIFLDKHHCQQVQGNYICPPLPADQVFPRLMEEKMRQNETFIDTTR